MDVYLEIGHKRTFASAVEWPGWARGGRDEADSIRRLLDYGARYSRSLGLPASAFVAPDGTSEFEVVERVEGNASTDFGVPGRVPEVDERPTDGPELDRLIDLLRRAWRAFADAADDAEGRPLAPAGPRGGGRTLGKMRSHIADAEQAYLQRLGSRYGRAAEWVQLQAAFIDALGARARGEVADAGPRGGRRWPVRYAVRRSAWHALDHAWEIEDRLRSADAPELVSGQPID